MIMKMGMLVGLHYSENKVMEMEHPISIIKKEFINRSYFPRNKEDLRQFYFEEFMMHSQLELVYSYL